MSRAQSIAAVLLFALPLWAAWSGRDDARAADKSDAPAKIKILTSGDSDLQIRVLAHAEPAEDDADDETDGATDDELVDADDQGDAMPAEDEQGDSELADEDLDSAVTDEVERTDSEAMDAESDARGDWPPNLRPSAAATRASDEDEPDDAGFDASAPVEGDYFAEDPDADDGATSPDGDPDAAGEPTPADGPEPAPTDVGDSPSPDKPSTGAQQAVDATEAELPGADDDRTDDEVAATPIRQPLPPPASAAAFKPVRFKGVQPLTTDREGLRSAWGPPKALRKIEGGVEMTFKIEPYERVVVTVEEDLVTSIVIVLTKPTPADLLAAQLELGDDEPAAIADAQGQPIGQAYPEKGALMMLAPRSAAPLAVKVMIEAIDAAAFVARADRTLHSQPTRCLADVEQALSIDAEHGPAWNLKARVLLQIGRLNEAAKAAQQAMEIEPDEPAHRLLHAEILAALADFPASIVVAREISESKSAPALLRARSELLWGDCLAQSADRDYAEAIQHHQQAIQLAEPIAAKGARGARIAAKQILLEAHLGAAHDIGWGNWQQQNKFTQKWIDKSLGILDDLIGRERQDGALRLHAYQRALTALSGIVGEPPDPQRLAELAARVGRERLAQAKDERFQQTIAWELGLAMAASAEIEHARGRDERALHDGQLATEQLDAGSPIKSESPTHDLIVGQAFFRLGTLHATARADHEQAIEWYERATPLLESPVPDCAASDLSRRGDAFVTMAVSYWDSQRPTEAVRLTRQGAKILDQAVKLGLADPESLSVPYSNLANMCRELGQQRDAREFAALAERAKSTQRK